MSTSASSIPVAIRDRISAPAQPRVWTPEDFADLGPRTAVDQALHRLVASRTLRRIARGFYDIPQANRLTGKPTYPNPRDVIDALARKGKVRVVVKPDGDQSGPDPISLKSTDKGSISERLKGHGRSSVPDNLMESRRAVTRSQVL